MKKLLFLTLLTFLLLAQTVQASNVISCTVNPQEVNLSVSNQVTVIVQLNNSENMTVNENVKITFPTAYLSCVGDCRKNVTTPPYSISTVSFTLQALNATTIEQSIKVDEPASYNCPSVLKIISAVGVDTKPPTVGSVTPTSIVAGQSTTFTASVSDDVGVTGCTFFLADKSYTASVSNNTASYTIAVSEGGYSAYFKCWDAAGNSANGATVTVTASRPQPTASLSVSITLPKTTYYPVENFEPRVTITDASGKFVVDATIKSNITGPKKYYPYFYYSALCDCYKGYQWFDEGALSGDYTLLIEASHPDFKTTTASAMFRVIKPTIQTFTITTDKKEYLPGDSMKLTITMKDSLGNLIKDAYITGEIREADTGNLVSSIRPYIFGDVYMSTYYLGYDSLGKSYKISVNTTWKEQKASADTIVTVPKKGLNAEMILEKTVFMPGDILQGKIKVFDKDGNIIKDAKVWVEIIGESSAAAAVYKTGSIRSLSATYVDGFYEIEKWKIEDWISPGNYTITAKIGRIGESITLEKSIEITKEKLNVNVVFDQTSYSPGDKIYIKIYVTHPNGSIVPNANIAGEIFPLIQEVVNQTAGVTGAAILVSPGTTLAIAETPTIVGLPRFCRIYVYPLAPIYYKGEYYPRYYLDDKYIPNDCPVGMYALRLKISAHGYADTEYNKEFNVALHKLLLETGFKFDSKPDTVDLSIYAEVKDEEGKIVPYASVRGYLYPIEGDIEKCTKTVYFGYNEFTKRYTSKIYLGKYECPAGKYSLKITASQPSYETATTEQTVEINYTEGYKYNVVVPPAIAMPMVCKEVSCGTNCVNKICETPVTPQECYEEVTDKDCIQSCMSEATAVEKAAAEKTAAEVDVKDCVNDCVKKISCKGSAVTPSGSQEMLDKLEGIEKELKGTQEQLNVIVKLLRAIVDFFSSIAKIFGGGRTSELQIAISPNITNETGT